MFTVEGPDAATDPVPMDDEPCGERPATSTRRRYGAMHPDRIPEEAALSLHEKRQLRKLSHQLVTFRLWDDQQDTDSQRSHCRVDSATRCRPNPPT